MRERLGKLMGINNIITAFVVCMLALVPFSIASMDGEATQVQQPTVMHTTGENASGWLAALGERERERENAGRQGKKTHEGYMESNTMHWKHEWEYAKHMLQDRYLARDGITGRKTI